jgi:hypothetical protein
MTLDSHHHYQVAGLMPLASKLELGVVIDPPRELDIFSRLDSLETKAIAGSTW